MLYTKSLRISSAAKAAVGVGAIVNLQSNDASKLWNLPQYGHMIWSGPFQVPCCSVRSHSKLRVGKYVYCLHVCVHACFAKLLLQLPLCLQQGACWCPKSLTAVRPQAAMLRRS